MEGCITQLLDERCIYASYLENEEAKSVEDGHYKYIFERKCDGMEINNIYCYNCNDDFRITTMNVAINNLNVLSFDFDFLKFINYEKIYGEDRVYRISDIFPYDLVRFFRDDIRNEIHIELHTDGHCDKIKIVNKWSLFELSMRKLMVEKIRSDPYHSFKISKLFTYKPGTKFIINMSSIANINISGIIVSGFDNIKNINKVTLDIDNKDHLFSPRFACLDKLTLMMNTVKLNDNTIYIPFSTTTLSYKKVDMHSYLALNRHRIQILFGHDNPSVTQKLKVGFYYVVANTNTNNNYEMYVPEMYITDLHIYQKDEK